MKHARNCPECGQKIFYSSKYYCTSATKNNRKCKQCHYNSLSITMYGKNNPFYGKKHTIKTKQKLSKIDKSYTQTESFRKKISSVTSGEKNPMFGKSVYKTWVNKFGKNEANKRLLKFRSKLSKRNSGKGNPMYGKPSPQGSGNGWKGHYKGWFFRSLLELSYMVNVIEANNWSWISAESCEFMVPYIDPIGNQRNYFADFIINNKTMVECKSKRLIETPLIKCKIKAAKNFCKKHKLAYQILEPEKISKETIRSLVSNGDIVLLPKYQKMLEELD